MIRVLFNHILPFVLGCLCGVAVFYLVTPVGVPVPQNISGWGHGTGASGMSGRCVGSKTDRWTGADTFEPEQSSPFRITSKPRATYTDEARQNNTEGSVLLKVTLLASG